MTETAHHFSLGKLMIGVTAFCMWLALYRVSSELFVGVLLLFLAVVWSKFRYQKFFRAGTFQGHELLAVGFLLVIGIGLVARFLTGVYSP